VAIATFRRSAAGSAAALAAGRLIGGLSILLYWAFIMFGALGVLALAVLTWRASPDAGAERKSGISCDGQL